MMARVKRMYFGVGAMLLTLGLLWTPGTAVASSEGPQNRHGEQICAELHKVVLGENLTWIADEHGVSVEELTEANGIEDANLIVENQTLCIPHSQKGNKNQRGSIEDWSSHGIPGHSYDPSLIKGPENGGKPENGYGPENGNGPRESTSQEKWQPSYEPPGKAGEPSVKHEEPKRNSGYWKDDLRYPRSSTDDIDPSDSEEPAPSLDPELPPEVIGDDGGQE